MPADYARFMGDELLFTVHGSTATRAEPLTMAEAGLRERRDLQAWVVAHPEILGSDIMIVTMEFDRWQSGRGKTSDRLDILGLHSSGELVVAELKRDRAPDTVEMQAVKYAAMVSRFTIETLAEQHAKFLSQTGPPIDDEAAGNLLAAHAPDITLESLRRPRLVLLASEYPPTTAATAVWLREMGIDITLMQYRAYRTGGEIAVSVSQLFPIPSIEDFTISPRQAEVRAVEETRRKRQDVGTVAKIIDGKLLADGTQLWLRPYGINQDLRSLIDAWIAKDPRRGVAAWQNDEKAPLVWQPDGGSYTPSGLAALILDDAAGVRRSIRGGTWWVDADERDLVELAAQLDGERGPLYYRFWKELVRIVAERHLDWSATPSTSNWLNFNSTIPGSAWEVVFAHGRILRSGLYFWNDKAAFNRLFARREEIERAFGGPLEWENSPHRKFSRVSLTGSGDVADQPEWPRMLEWMIDTQKRLRDALPRHSVAATHTLVS